MRANTKYYYSLLVIMVISSVFTVNSLVRLANRSENPVVVTEAIESRLIPTVTPIVIAQPTSQELSPTLIPTVTSTPVVNNINVYVTYYGWSDNDPPGPIIAYPHNRYSQTLHNNAGGIGTYDDPITFASDPSVFPIGTKIYVPYIKKYIIMEDLCASCSGNHIDIWMQSNGSFATELFACQNRWTRESTLVEKNPPRGRAVEYTLTFNENNGECLQ